jgi:hypothetical protein
MRQRRVQAARSSSACVRGLMVEKTRLGDSFASCHAALSLLLQKRNCSQNESDRAGFNRCDELERCNTVSQSFSFFLQSLIELERFHRPASSDASMVGTSGSSRGPSDPKRVLHYTYQVLQYSLPAYIKKPKPRLIQVTAVTTW